MKPPIALPELRHPEDVRLLWHNGYWDGVLSGIASYMGRECWFGCPDPARCHREYVVYPLTDQEIKTERHWHDLFRAHVGSHTDYTYDESGRRSRPIASVKARASWHLFYDAAKDRPPRDNFTDREPIGVFSLRKCPHYRRARSRRYWERKES